MRLWSIPTDIAISACFVALFLLAFIPSEFGVWLAPDVLLVIRELRERRKAKGRATAGSHRFT